MSALPPHCIPATPLLESVSSFFGTCIPSNLALASTTCGYLSILSWLFAQMPQIIKNHRRKSTEGLSLGFLGIWLAGDVCNFLGAVWTHQMFFQQIIGIYYVLVDLTLVCQYFYFSPRPLLLLVDDTLSDTSSLVSSDEPKAPKSPKSRKTQPRSITSRLLVTVVILAHVAGASPVSPSSAPALASTGFMDTPLTKEVLGTYLSWLSTLAYLTSRLPQLLLNLSRRSTEGLAISLFIAAFFGNFFYSASILLNPLGHGDYPAWGGGGLAGEDGSRRDEWWGRTIPFLIGAAGVLILDAAVGWQWVLWGEGEETGSGKAVMLDAEEAEEVFEAEVPGGRNGWVPWGGVRGGESEGLLAAEQARAERYGETKYGTPGRA